MKWFATLLIAMGASAMLCAGQQTVDPALNTHVKDNASFGNQKSPKKDKAATSRTVTGQVTDETGQVLQGALVTLTDKKTNERTTYFTKKDGRYQFEDLSFTKDYSVQARYKDKESDARKLSQFDTAPRPVRILEINTGTGTAPASAGSTQPK